MFLEVVKFIFQDFKHWLVAFLIIGALSQFRLVEISVNKPTMAVPDLHMQAPANSETSTTTKQ